MSFLGNINQQNVTYSRRRKYSAWRSNWPCWLYRWQAATERHEHKAKYFISHSLRFVLSGIHLWNSCWVKSRTTCCILFVHFPTRWFLQRTKKALILSGDMRNSFTYIKFHSNVIFDFLSPSYIRAVLAGKIAVGEIVHRFICQIRSTTSKLKTWTTSNSISRMQTENSFSALQLHKSPFEKQSAVKKKRNRNLYIKKCHWFGRQAMEGKGRSYCCDGQQNEKQFQWTNEFWFAHSLSLSCSPPHTDITWHRVDVLIVCIFCHQLHPPRIFVTPHSGSSVSFVCYKFMCTLEYFMA